MKELIRKLIEVPGPSGFEGQIRELIRDEVAPYTKSLRVDNLGNLICRVNDYKADSARIMIAAHMDEIGVMVTHVDETGFARFIPIGGVLQSSCPGMRVQFLNGSSGVIGVERLDSNSKSATFEQMFIDLGVDQREACPVKIGDAGVFERTFTTLGSRMVSKAMDDRIGVAVLIETIKRISTSGITCPQQIDVVFSVQEEVGLRGAATAAFGLEPDIGLAIDVTRSGDTPRGVRMDVSLGKGPAIKVRDQGMLADPRVVRWMVERAEGSGIPYQLEVLERGSTDASAIQLSRSGVPSGCLSIPCRYIHTPSEMVDINDVENAVKLLLELLQHPLDNGSAIN